MQVCVVKIEKSRKESTMNKNVGAKSDLAGEFCFIFEKSNTISCSLFKNVLNEKNTYVIHFPLAYKSNLIAKIYNRYLSKLRINCNKQKRKYHNKIVVLTNEALSVLSDEQIYYIKKKARAIVLFFIDELFNDYVSVKRAKELFQKKDNIFDLVYTFSDKDAKTYSIKVNHAYYSKYEANKEKSGCDIFFLGNLKNRDEILNGTAEYFSENNINAHYVVAAPRNKKNNKKFDYRLIPYNENINFINSANCIFDIVDERQSGMTLRYYEAIVYNKKLLTNNVNIVNAPYYDSRYMKIYKTVDDIKNIDIGWFTRNENINYGYKSEYEPENFLKTIKIDLSQRN